MAKKQPYPKVNALRVWREKASPELRQRLLKLASTSEAMLWQWQSGRRNLSADMAGKVAEATMQIYEQFTEDAPAPLLRGELCKACSKCPHFLDALGDVEIIEID